MYLNIVKEWKTKTQKKELSDFSVQILNDTIEIINNLINLGEKNNKQFNKLQVEYEKSKIIFERKIEQLKGVS